jgi:hypothetical protein
VGLRRSPALPVVAELRVEGAQPGLDLYVRLVGEDLVLAGFGCVESLRDEQGRVELSGRRCARPWPCRPSRRARRQRGLRRVPARVAGPSEFPTDLFTAGAGLRRSCSVGGLRVKCGLDFGEVAGHQLSGSPTIAIDDGLRDVVVVGQILLSRG